MADRKTLANSLKMLTNPEQLQNIGSAVVKEVIARAVMRKAASGHFRQTLTIKKGEFVPKSFRDQLNIEVDREGRATANWPSQAQEGTDYFEVCYEDANPGYCECWPDSVDFERRITDLALTHVRALAGATRTDLEAQFSAEEIKLLQKHGIIER